MRAQILDWVSKNTVNENILSFGDDMSGWMDALGDGGRHVHVEGLPPLDNIFEQRRIVFHQGGGDVPDKDWLAKFCGLCKKDAIFLLITNTSGMDELGMRMLLRESGWGTIHVETAGDTILSVASKG